MTREKTKPEPRADAKHRIIRAAVQLFAQKGYDATSVREVAEAADITKPTLYYYFGSKEGLGVAILQEAQQKMEAYLREGTKDATGVYDRLVGFVEAHFRGCMEEKELSQFLYGLSFSPQQSTLKFDVKSFQGGSMDMLNGMLDAGTKDGIIREGVRDDANRILMGIINIHLMGFLKLGLDLSRERAERAVRLFLEGVGTKRVENRDGEKG